MRFGNVVHLKEAVRFSDIEIRFCVPTTATRVLDDADIRLFTAVHKAGSKIPIVFVGTMTDKFLDEKETKIRRALGEMGTNAAIEADLQEAFLTRQDEIISEIGDTLRENRLPSLDATTWVAKGKKTCHEL